MATIVKSVFCPFVPENLGWLLMRTLGNEINTLTGYNWWLPANPLFVTPFTNPLPSLSPDVQNLILRTGLIDTTLSHWDYTAQFNVRLALFDLRKLARL